MSEAPGAFNGPAPDPDLVRDVRRTGHVRNCFYGVVLLVALAGQVTGAVETLHMPLLLAVPAVGALELGGVVVMANADVRRRLGERAVISRVLSAAIAAGAVAFNWLAHTDHLLGGFFAGMSALGYLVYLMSTENKRRDRLRATGDLPETAPVYPLRQWVRHPSLTSRARDLALVDSSLGWSESLTAARAQVRKERRDRALTRAIHAYLRKTVKDPDLIKVALALYDLEEISTMLLAGADYASLVADLSRRLAPAALTGDVRPAGRAGSGQRRAGGPDQTSGTPRNRTRPRDQTSGTPRNRTRPRDQTKPRRGTRPEPDHETGPDQTAGSDETRPDHENGPVAMGSDVPDQTTVTSIGRAERTRIHTLRAIASAYKHLGGWDELPGQEAMRVELKMGKQRINDALRRTDLLAWPYPHRRSAGPDQTGSAVVQ